MGRQKRVLLLCAKGVEEMEYIAIADVLIRCGIRVITAGVDGAHGVKGRQGLYLRPDHALESMLGHHFDAVILPGGEGGAKVFCKSDDVGEILRDHDDRGALVCAMCASPTALKAHGIGLQKSLTSYPAFKNELMSSYNYKNKAVVVDDNLITSQGPGTAAYFALEIADQLVGTSKAKEVSDGMLIQ